MIPQATMPDRPNRPSNESITTRNDSVLMPPVIRTYPVGRSTWIIPNAGRRLCSPLDRAASLASASVTRTDSKLTVSVFPGPSNPCRYCLRH
jgi:hypothetical protein